MTTPLDAQQNEPSTPILESGLATRTWYLKLSATWHNMSQVLGLKRLQELIQGTCSLSEEPLWLLGLWYGLHDRDSNSNTLPQEMLELLLQDFSSKYWFTYRKDFPPIGSSQLSSDVGWGCTIRSGQMMMAEALARCWWGRTTTISMAGGVSAAAAAAAAAGAAAGAEAAAAAAGPGGALLSNAGVVFDQLPLLQLFQDHPGPAAPFSIHSICRSGAQHGVVPGQWLGPWVLCKALAAAAADHQQEQQWHLGLQVHVVCDPGGGAPALQLHRLRQHFLTAQGVQSSTGSAAEAEGQQLQQEQSQAPQQPQPQQAQQQQGLLLLVPLTLGVGRVNERYLPQLAAVLTFPQSVGIVGGRPGASLYFLGVQGSAVLYLDPHEVQEVAELPGDVSSFHCTTPRVMPLASIDPSLAIGFYCRDIGDLEDLASRLEQLADTAAGAPLMTVDRQEAHQQQPEQQQGYGSATSAAATAPRPSAAEQDNAAANEQQQCEGEEWEFV